MTRRQRTNLLLSVGLRNLASLNTQDAELLAMRFCQQLPMSETRRCLNYAESTVYAKQNMAIARLAAILYGLEVTAWHERAALLAGRLEPSPDFLAGIDGQVQDLATVLAAPHGPKIIAVEGIGGIGKTTLAAAVMRRLAAETVYEDFAWVSAQVVDLDLCGDVRPRPQPVLTAEALVRALAQQLLPTQDGSQSPALQGLQGTLGALRRRLKEAPHLVVVDNLETVLDPQTLLPLLHTLVDPSRFIITTRRRLIAEPSVHLHDVPELNERDALALLRHAASERNLPAIALCADAELLPIYRLVGGNPLALLLVLGQTHVRPLHAVLADLQKARDGRDARSHYLPALFGYVFRQAWDGLSGSERRTLLRMRLAAAGEHSVGDLAAACDLTAGQATAALQRLIQANLLYTEGNLEQCSYRLHSLTRRFLEEVAASSPSLG